MVLPTTNPHQKDYEEVGDNKRRCNPSKSMPQVKPLEMPTFSGEFFDWAAWKESAEIYFQAALVSTMC